MRRAYIESHCPLPEAFALARTWAGSPRVTLIAPSTSTVEATAWLEPSGLPIGVTSRKHSRFSARPSGTVIGWLLDLGEVLDVESGGGVTGIVLTGATSADAAWVTAHEPELLGGDQIPQVPEASVAIKTMVAGISMIAVHNQGLTDSRERSMAVQALTYMRGHDHQLHPSQLIVEAIRNRWPGQSPLELANIARDLNDGKRLRFESRIRPEVLAKWAATA